MFIIMFYRAILTGNNVLNIALPGHPDWELCSQ